MTGEGFKHVAVVGLGLIGGSFALALRAAGFEGEIVGVSSPLAIEAGLRKGAIARGVSLAEAADTADLIYLAQPVDRILHTIEVLGPLVGSGCLVTDAGSTKRAIVKKAQERLPSAQFLGGHPLAGKEQRGMDAAEPGLFSARPYVLTPTRKDVIGIEWMREWLSRMGAHVIELSAEDHDRTVALTSHIPQIISTALALSLRNEENEQLASVFGPGLLDMTRLALSDVDLWAGILEGNRDNVQRGLKGFLDSLLEIQAAIGKADLGKLFHSAATFSREIRKPALTKLEV